MYLELGRCCGLLQDPSQALLKVILDDPDVDLPVEIRSIMRGPHNTGSLMNPIYYPTKALKLRSRRTITAETKENDDWGTEF